ncbi:MAG: methionyl-tRNA formyltransferase [Verrucomicrobia bacterium]|nr:methionyl-tRNA formyltransferase [Verrucomicrobiota bacterium]
MIRCVFMGSSHFSLPALSLLAAANEVELVAVVTQPDRPSGRNRTLKPGPVHALAGTLGLTVHMPERLAEVSAVHALAEVRPDVIVVASYGQFIPRPVRELPPLGIVNIHPSLLPKYRGAAPMQWALANGDTETGVTLFHIEKEMDAGDIILQEPFAIDPADNGCTLEEKLSVFGAKVMLRAVRMLASGTAPRHPQDHRAATYAPKLTKEQGHLDWSLPADILHNRIRGYQPWPGCYTFRQGARLRIWRSELEAGDGVPGSVISAGRDGLVLAAGQGALRLIEVQPEGKSRMPTSAYLLGHPMSPGDQMG